jgi:hypothetical protein
MQASHQLNNQGLMLLRFMLINQKHRWLTWDMVSCPTHMHQEGQPSSLRG